MDFEVNIELLNDESFLSNASKNNSKTLYVTQRTMEQHILGVSFIGSKT